MMSWRKMFSWNVARYPPVPYLLIYLFVYLYIYISIHLLINPCPYISLFASVWFFFLPCICRYLQVRENRPKPDEGKVIAMSLDDRMDKHTFGAIRNIILSGIVFPGWTVRVYLQHSSSNSGLPQNLAALLRTHPFQFVYVNNEIRKLDPSLWPLLAVDDTTVDYLLVRKPTGRLSARDAAIVSVWLDTGKTVHVIKDHPVHSGDKIVAGLWGINAKDLRKRARKWGFRKRLLASSNETDFLNHALWPKLADQALCHDSCWSTKYCKPFPVKRVGQEYLGQEFDSNDEPIVDVNAPNITVCTKIIDEWHGTHSLQMLLFYIKLHRYHVCNTVYHGTFQTLDVLHASRLGGTLIYTKWSKILNIPCVKRLWIRMTWSDNGSGFV